MLGFGQLPDAGERVGHQRDLRLRRLQPPRRQRQPASGGAPSLRQLSRAQLAGDLPAGLPADDRRHWYRLLGSRAGSAAMVSGWNYDLGAEFGHNDFDYNISNTLNASLGPCLDVASCAPGPDGILGTADDPGIPNQTSFFAGRVLREEFVTALNVAQAGRTWACRAPVNLAFGVAFRRERYAIRPGELASYINGLRHRRRTAPTSRGGRLQVFPGFTPGDDTDQHRTNVGIYADAETDLSTRRCCATWPRGSSTTATSARGVTGKAAVRYQPSRRVTLRAAAQHRLPRTGTEPGVLQQGGDERDRGPGSSTSASSRWTIRLRWRWASKPLKDETSFNLSGGLVVTPMENLTFTADYFHIRINNRDPARRHVRRRRDAAASCPHAGFGNIGGRPVLHQRPRHPDAGSRRHGQPAGPGRRQRHARPHRRRQLHQEQDHPRGPAAPGAGGRRLDRAGPAGLA